MNLGTDATQLRAALITPVPNFFVRSHAPVPVIAADAYRLHVDGLVDRPCTLTLEELQHGFPVHTVTATLQCAGLRRRELTALEPIDAAEIVWETDAISTARWTGVRLSDILRRVGVQPAAAHVGFLGLDQVAKTEDGLGGSIPLAKAWEDDVLLAYGMNDAPLLPIHGYPLRALVPGYIGARSVKWVGRITLQVAPSSNHFQARAYKLFPSSVRAETVNWEEGEMLGALPINSFITSPQAGVLPTSETWRGAVLVQGIALAGGDAVIERVELSNDSGQTWTAATLTSPPQQWVWCFWEATCSLSPGSHELVVRAFDTAGHTQPMHLADVWNFKGYVNNAYHRVRISV